MVNAIEAYIMVYEAISQYQKQTGNDDIARMLSDMEPWPYKNSDGVELFGSADPAVFDSEWVSAWNNIVGKDSCGTQAQILRVANEVLRYYSNTVGYNLEGTDLALRNQLRELAAAS
jgi:hypothetical protein